MPHLDQRSGGQVWIADELTGQSVSTAPEAQLVTNAVRHVFEIPDEAFTRAFRKAALAFEERDCSEVETTNWVIRMDRPRLRGVHTAFRTAQNYRFEVEFPTPASYRAELAHRAQSECELVPIPRGAGRYYTGTRQEKAGRGRQGPPGRPSSQDNRLRSLARRKPARSSRPSVRGRSCSSACRRAASRPSAPSLPRSWGWSLSTSISISSPITAI